MYFCYIVFFFAKIMFLRIILLIHVTDLFQSCLFSICMNWLKLIIFFLMNIWVDIQFLVITTSTGIVCIVYTHVLKL